MGQDKLSTKDTTFIFDVRPGAEMELQLNAISTMFFVLLLFLLRMAAHPGMTFQQDNARITTQFLQQNNIDLLPWLSMSPDLSPIEHT